MANLLEKNRETSPRNPDAACWVLYYDRKPTVTELKAAGLFYTDDLGRESDPDFEVRPNTVSRKAKLTRVCVYNAE